MVVQSKPLIFQRKRPQQARSTELVAAILEAAAQVLAAEGAQGFTTARVAERAGVSIGSLYQYFPNRESILFRLQADEWRETTDLWGSILGDATRPPTVRLRRLVHAFLRSEIAEAALRNALDDAAPFYRDALEAHEIHAEGSQIAETFMREALPRTPEAERGMIGTLIFTTITAVGKEFSETPGARDDIDAHADAMADMLCAYLEDAGRSRPR